MSFNKITLIGHLGRDPELRYTPQGDAVADFSMATNDRKRDKSGEFQDTTTWFKVTLWRKLAENASKYLTKGSHVYIEGRLQVEEWTDRENNKRFSLVVQASEMQFLSGRSENTGSHEGSKDDYETHSGPPQSAPSSFGAASGGNSPKPVQAPAGADDDIPF